MNAHECAQGRCIWCGIPSERAGVEPCPVERATSLRRLGDYCPTPGAVDTCDWRDPERAKAVGRALLSGLDQAARSLGNDELRVLLYVADRLRMGATQYGRLDLATDARDWRVELGQEAADALVYAACRALTDATGGER
jgi:hypothetical protein